MQVNLRHMPKASPTYVVDFPKLNGGLNLRELSYRLGVNESPDMKNLWWQDGILQCRDGQEWLSADPTLGTGYACYNRLFHGFLVFHAGTKLYYGKPTIQRGYLWERWDEAAQTWVRVAGHSNTLTVPISAETDGTQYRCTVSGAAGETPVVSSTATLTVASEVSVGAAGVEPAYSETLGIIQQPANYAGPAGTDAVFVCRASGVGPYTLCSGVPAYRGTFFRYQDDLYYKNKGGYLKISYSAAATNPLSAADMTAATLAYTPVIVINASPENGSGTTYQPENRLSPRKEIHYNADGTSTAYYLPVKPVDAVVSVKVDGVTKTAGTDYTVDLTNGVVTFQTAPDPGDPPANNTVEIVYSKANTDALNSVLDCPYGFVAGEGANLCVLLAGCPAQPNAVFWNSNDNLSMNPGYFPMSYYNLCGATGDAVTGFGMQYSDLILFSERSIGKLKFSIQTVSERDSISFTYENINDQIGCNLPWSIQLVQNNLVFCNTDRGVYIVRSSSAAYENNVDCISDKLDGGSRGLTADVRAASLVVSADDGRYYWLGVGDKVYAWNYEESSANDPSWYYFSGVSGVAYFSDGENGWYHLDATGRLTKFIRSFTDYGDVVQKYYTFPTQFFGGYDRLKDVIYILLTVRGDTDSVIHIRYDTDYEKRVDLTPIQNFTWRLSPRNLAYRCLAVVRYGRVAKRLPGCRHVRHFSMTLADWGAGEDLAIVSAQIFYRYSGKER